MCVRVLSIPFDGYISGHLNGSRTRIESSPLPLRFHIAPTALIYSTHPSRVRRAATGSHSALQLQSVQPRRKLDAGPPDRALLPYGKPHTNIAVPLNRTVSTYLCTTCYSRPPKLATTVTACNTRLRDWALTLHAPHVRAQHV